MVYYTKYHKPTPFTKEQLSAWARGRSRATWSLMAGAGMLVSALGLFLGLSEGDGIGLPAVIVVVLGGTVLGHGAHVLGVTRELKPETCKARLAKVASLEARYPEVAQFTSAVANQARALTQAEACHLLFYYNKVVQLAQPA